MTGMKREIVFDSGARFFRDDGGTVMFAYRIDASTEIGPRKATDADMAKHADAYAEFTGARRGPGRPRKVA